MAKEGVDADYGSPKNSNADLLDFESILENAGNDLSAMKENNINDLEPFNNKLSDEKTNEFENLIDEFNNYHQAKDPMSNIIPGAHGPFTTFNLPPEPRKFHQPQFNLPGTFNRPNHPSHAKTIGEDQLEDFLEFMEWKGKLMTYKNTSFIDIFNCTFDVDRVFGFLKLLF